MNRPTFILMSFLLVGLSLPAAAAVNAWLDHDQVGPGETVQLTLQHDGQTDAEPDLAPLQQDFDIAGRSSGSNIRIINGQMNAQTQISLMLVPKHNGKLQIPALHWDGQTTTPLSVTVSSTAAPQQGNAQAGKSAAHVFLSVASEQKHPYVQAAVPVTVRIYTDQPLYQAGLDFQSGNDVLVQQLGQDRQTTETRNGRTYQVVERRFLLFPQRSGRLQLDGPVLNAQIQDGSNNPFGNDRFFSNVFGRNPFAGMLGSTRPIRVNGDPVVLDVRPRPVAAQGHDWLPAQKLSIEGRWQPDGGSVHAGDPVTLHLQLDADGLTAAQLPDLSRQLQLPDGLRAYPDQPRLSNNTHGDTVAGTRAQDIAIIASTPGHYTIPALHLSWWDIASDTPREVELPAHTLDVQPAPGGIAISTAPPPAPPSATPEPLLAALQASDNPSVNQRWKWSSLAFAALWLGTLTAWWYSSRRSAPGPASRPVPADAPTPAPRLSEARNAFWQACRANDASAARRHLLDWAQATWPQDPPRGLNELAERLEGATFTPLLRQLDRACYATGGAWQGAGLLELKTLGNTSGTTPQPGLALAALYP